MTNIYHLVYDLDERATVGYYTTLDKAKAAAARHAAAQAEKMNKWLGLNDGGWDGRDSEDEDGWTHYTKGAEAVYYVWRWPVDPAEPGDMPEGEE